MDKISRFQWIARGIVGALIKPNHRLLVGGNVWLSGEHGLKIDREAGIVSISSIFDWFGEDWKTSYGTDEGFAGSNTQKAVLNFISNYVSEEDAAYLKAGDYRLKYLDYDWSLNKQ